MVLLQPDFERRRNKNQNPSKNPEGIKRRTKLFQIREDQNLPVNAGFGDRFSVRRERNLSLSQNQNFKGKPICSQGFFLKRPDHIRSENLPLEIQVERKRPPNSPGGDQSPKKGRDPNNADRGRFVQFLLSN